MTAPSYAGSSPKLTDRDVGFSVWMSSPFGREGGPVSIPRGVLTIARARATMDEILDSFTKRSAG